ncbi:MAG: hypothetical protein V5A64_03460 [Candidatus Thermoplasmatota archaeon]
MKKNDSAQIQVLEVIIVAGIIFASLYFIQGLTSPTFPESYQKKPLKTRVKSAIDSIDSVPDDEYRSLLVRYMVENTTENKRTLGNRIWNLIFPSYGYHIYKYNLSKMYKNSSATVDDYRTLYVTNNPPEVGKKVQASKIFVHDGYLYEIVVEAWYQ